MLFYTTRNMIPTLSKQFPAVLIFLFLLCILVSRVSLCSSSWPETHFITQAGFEPEVLLPESPFTEITAVNHPTHFLTLTAIYFNTRNFMQTLIRTYLV